MVVGSCFWRRDVRWRLCNLRRFACWLTMVIIGVFEEHGGICGNSEKERRDMMWSS